MKISEVIAKLEEIQKEHGDINCVVEEEHDYWGSLQTYVDEHNIKVSEHAQPEGPKSGKSEKAVVFSYS